MGSRPEISAALLKAAREISQPRELQTTLDTIVETAAHSLPGIDHVGITIASRSGAMETKAGSDTFVWEMDRLQYELHEGPCLHAITVEPVTTVEWAGRDLRWPRFMPLAVAKGLRSQMGLRLYTEKETLGGLNLYSTSSDTIDPARSAHGGAVRCSRVVDPRARPARRAAEHRLLTRKIIGQAIGILMERHSLDEDGAFAYLTRVSSAHQRQATQRRPGDRRPAQRSVQDAGATRRPPALTRSAPERQVGSNRRFLITGARGR